MRVHATLGQAGRAAGVGQHTQVLRPHLKRGHWLGTGQCLLPVQHFTAFQRGQRVLRGQPCLPGLGHRFTLCLRWQVFTNLTDYHVLQSVFVWKRCTGLCQFRRQIGRSHGQPDACIGDVVLQLLRTVHRVDGYHHGIGTQDGKVGHHQLRQVLHEQDDAIAALHTGSMQTGCQSLSAIGQFTVADRAAKELQRHLVRIAARAGFKVVPQGSGRCRQSAGNAAGPVLVVQTHTVSSIKDCECSTR